MKRCRVCNEFKPLDEFYKSPGMADGYRHDCKVCNLAAKAARTAKNPQANRDRVRRWQLENPEKYKAKQAEYRRSGRKQEWDRKSYLKRTYGITVEAYDAMFEEQGGVCFICKNPRPEERTLHVDHDHATGKIRRLLCFRCNNALGDLDDSHELLLAAADYVAWDPELDALAKERVNALRR